VEEEQERSMWWNPTSSNVSDVHPSESKVYTLSVGSLYKILETVLVSEIILFLIGGFLVTNLSPFPLQIMYWVLIPWSIVITGLLFLIVLWLKRR
jgi:hypothetical protein